MNLEATYDAIEAARVKAESEVMPRAERALAARYSAAAAAYARGGKDAALTAGGSEEEAAALVAYVWTSAAPEFARSAYDAVAAMKRDAPPASAWVRRALDFLKGRAARAMARSIASTTAEGVARFIAAGLEAGEGVAEIALRIRRDGLLASRVRAVTIVRTEVIAASSWASQAGANQAAEDLGLTLDKVWLSTSDARTRDTHRAMGGQRRPIGEPYSVGGQAAMHPGDVALPAAERVRCFPAGTLVTARGVTGGYRRWYEGELVEVATSLGHEFSATPNHPVLTDRGWVAAGLLCEGDRLVCDPFDVELLAARPVDIEHVPTPIDEVVRSLAEGGDSERVLSGRVDFHGDGQDGHIEVVRANRLLQGDFVAPAGQRGGKVNLSPSDLVQRPLAAKGDGSEVLGGLRLATDGLVSGGGEGRPLLGRGAGHAHEHSIRAAPALNTARAQEPGNDVAADPVAHAKLLLRDPVPVCGADLGNEFGEVVSPAHAHGIGRRPHLDADALEVLVNRARTEPEALADLGDAQARQVQFADVVRVSRKWLSGHVFNLETESGWYSVRTNGGRKVPGIVVHNCRCTEYYVPSAKKSVPVSWRDERDAKMRARYAETKAMHEYGADGAIQDIANEVGLSFDHARAIIRKGRRR